MSIHIPRGTRTARTSPLGAAPGTRLRATRDEHPMREVTTAMVDCLPG